MLPRGFRVWSVLLVVAASACGGRESGVSEVRLLPPAEASRQVSDLLYGANLISDPDVNARMNHYVLQVSRDGRSSDSVMPEFHRWLASWAAQHPDRVSAARVAGRPAPASTASPRP